MHKSFLRIAGLVGLAIVLLGVGIYWFTNNKLRAKMSRSFNDFCTIDYEGGYITEVMTNDVTVKDSSGATHHLLTDTNTVYSNDDIHPINSSSLIKIGRLVLAYGTWCATNPPMFTAELIWRAPSGSP